MKALHGTAIYTGGGIYIAIGQLDNGNFFYGGYEWCSIFDADTREENEDEQLACCYSDWCEAHEIEADEAEVMAMFADFCKRLDNEEPHLTDGYEKFSNYAAGEVYRMMDIEDE